MCVPPWSHASRTVLRVLFVLDMALGLLLRAGLTPLSVVCTGACRRCKICLWTRFLRLTMATMATLGAPGERLGNHGS